MRTPEPLWYNSDLSTSATSCTRVSRMFSINSIPPTTALTPQSSRLLVGQNQWRRGVGGKCRHALEACLFEPGAILAHRVNAAFWRRYEHVQTEHQRERGAGAIFVGYEF